MLPEFYHKCISKVVTAKQYATLRIMILILQSYRTIQIEKLASILPVPIKYQSRRRHIQRFLDLPQLTTKCIWFPIIKKWLKIHQTKKKICYLAIDRTRWQERNLFVASLVKNKRAIPLNWMLLNKKGNSNIAEQKRLLKSTLRLLNLKQTIKAYSKRMGIEAMFKDCKSGGYNLEQCQAKDKRLLSLILLIAIALSIKVKHLHLKASKNIFVD
jgi:hypothetical protein